MVLFSFVVIVPFTFGSMAFQKYKTTDPIELCPYFIGEENDIEKVYS